MLGRKLPFRTCSPNAQTTACRPFLSRSSAKCSERRSFQLISHHFFERLCDDPLDHGVRLLPLEIAPVDPLVGQDFDEPAEDGVTY